MSGITEYLYDENGSLVREKEGSKTASYQYDLLNRQIHVRTYDGREQENFYDGEGLRAGIKEDGKVSTFLFLNGEILAESDGDRKPVRRHLSGMGLSHVEDISTGIFYTYHQDEQGSTAYITGSDGAAENCYIYDAFGNVLESRESVRNRILYTGQQYDQETGQYYLRARYYNPVIGRFVQEDTYRGDGLNLYAYCGNNPVMYYDPSGYAQQTACGKNNSENQEETGSFSVINEDSSDTTFDQSRIPKPGDADFVGPVPSGSWRLTPDGEGAHLVERSNIKGREELAIYDMADTPRYYPGGTPESAGQAHIRLHEATRNEGIKLKGGNANMTDQQLLDNYVNAYKNPDISAIRGDLRTPDSSVIIATNVSPSEAFEALLEWGKSKGQKF